MGLLDKILPIPRINDYSFPLASTVAVFSADQKEKAAHELIFARTTCFIETIVAVAWACLAVVCLAYGSIGGALVFTALTLLTTVVAKDIQAIAERQLQLVNSKDKAEYLAQIGEKELGQFEEFRQTHYTDLAKQTYLGKIWVNYITLRQPNRNE